MNNILKFKALVGMAKADGEFNPVEKDFILRLASLDGLSSQELKDLLNEKGHPSQFVKDLSFDDRIVILIDVVQLMKIDGKVLINELKFSEKLAKLLGFDEKSIEYLTGMIESNPDISPNFGRIIHGMEKFIIEP